MNGEILKFSATIIFYWSVVIGVVICALSFAALIIIRAYIKKYHTKNGL